MQPEKSIKIEHSLARNIDARPHGVILRFAIRHHNIQTISRAALEDNDQPLGACTRLGRTHGSASQKARHRRRANHGKRAVAKKNSTSNGHKTAPDSYLL